MHGRTASTAFDANDPSRKSSDLLLCDAQRGIFYGDVVGSILGTKGST